MHCVSLCLLADFIVTGIPFCFGEFLGLDKKATLQGKRKFQNKFHVIITNTRCNIVIEYSDTGGV